MFTHYNDNEFSVELFSDRLSKCCGVLEIGGFEEYHISIVKKEEKEFIRELKRLTDSDATEGVAITTINQQQHKVLDPILIKAGFTEVSRARNYNTQNVIYLYQKIIHKIRGRKPHKKTRSR